MRKDPDAKQEKVRRWVKIHSGEEPFSGYDPMFIDFSMDPRAALEESAKIILDPEKNTKGGKS